MPSGEQPQIMSTHIPTSRKYQRNGLPGYIYTLQLVLLTCFSLQGTIVRAETAVTSFEQAVADSATDPEIITRELDRIEHALKSATPPVKELDNFLSTLNKSKTWGQTCAGEQEQAQTKNEQLLAAVGKPVPGEQADVTRQRSRLGKDKQEIEKQLATCRVIAQRSELLGNAVSTIRKNIQSEQLFARGPDLPTLLMDTVAEPGVWLQATRHFVTDTSRLAELNQTDILIFVLVTGLAMVVGGYIRAFATHRIERAGVPAGTTDRCILALLLTIHRYAIALLATATAAVLLYHHGKGLHPVPFINIIAYGLPLVLVLTATINLLIHSLPVAGPATDEPKNIAKPLSYHLKILVILIFIGYLLFATIVAQSLPETVFLLARLIYGAVFIINLAWLLWLVGSTTQSKFRLFLRITASTLLLSSLVCDILGYHNLAGYIFEFVVGTVVVLGMYFLVSSIVRDQLDALEEGRGGRQHRLRSALGLKPEQPVPGIVWIRLLFTLTLWTGLLLGLIKVWQIPQSTVEDLLTHVANGFTIGTFLLKPLNIAQSLLALVLLLTLNSWFRKWLEQEWLARTHMDRGARESVAMISGYVGISIAFLIALGIAGMDFSKLAIIAGALSVGIGFGLQNIVNNFISGLILLFERPVKTGDWIVVGDVEGYVKRISIRTTQIMTFDRADVIVPNTALISGNVTNLMLHNRRGRLRIPVGVAYGSDTGKVRELLLGIANEHAEVMGEGFRVSAPYVLFTEFGDSSLNFELRCFIPDIDRRRRIISDINFAIDAAFREHGIEIPFPQRDLHIRDNGKNTAGAASGITEAEAGSQNTDSTPAGKNDSHE